jgi:membrane protease YdiL (CAAX protease family)
MIDFIFVCREQDVVTHDMEEGMFALQKLGLPGVFFTGTFFFVATPELILCIGIFVSFFIRSSKTALSVFRSSILCLLIHNSDSSLWEHS